MSNPLISVILPYYNAETTIKAAIVSILQQSFSYFELLVVNNASTDNSPVIVEQLAKQDERIKCLTAPIKGVSHDSKEQSILMELNHNLASKI